MNSARCPQCGLWPVVIPGKVGPGGYSITEPTVCVSYRCYGYCPFGLDCQYEHIRDHCPFGQMDIPTDVFISALTRISNRMDEFPRGPWTCSVCKETSRPVEENARVSEAPVGETFLSPFCLACGNFYFQPYIQEIMMRVIQTVGIDYEKYKSEVDRIRATLPERYRIPFSYEAHRWGTSRFSWSLFNTGNATDVLRYISAMVQSERLPPLRRLVSVGAGRGYTEHVMNQASLMLMNESPPVSYGFNAPLVIDAFDNMTGVPRTLSFSVEVQNGTPQTLLQYETLKDSILFLSWPPFGSNVNNESTMGFDALKNYEARGGCVLVYIGDPTATGDWRYHETLLSRWEKEPFMCPVNVWVPEEMGLVYAGNDQAAIYRKRDVPLDLPPVQWVVQR